ncbi:MAG: hypothetical protein MZU91_02330 [Desulfosudis oleivorans]|nr:hypothetical protein [Desulfosudis oleivorans]
MLNRLPRPERSETTTRILLPTSSGLDVLIGLRASAALPPHARRLCARKQICPRTADAHRA